MIPGTQILNRLKPNTAEPVEFFRIQNRLDQDATDIYILDAIGEYGVDPEWLIRDLNQIHTQKINVYINSPGGDAFAGIAIMNALKDHPATVCVYVQGMAASAASIIIMGGDEIVMCTGSMVMIHDPWVICGGTAQNLRARAAMLEKIGDAMCEIYAEKSGKYDVDQWKEMMSAETWLTAKEAVEYGIADSIKTEGPPEVDFDETVKPPVTKAGSVIVKIGEKDIMTPDDLWRNLKDTKR